MYDFLRILLALHIDGFYFWKMVYILLILNYVTGSTFWGIFWISICIKDFINQNLASVRHLIDILPLSLELYFSPWLTTDQVRLKCAEGINQHKGKKTDEERLEDQSDLPTSKNHKSEKGSKLKTYPHDTSQFFTENSDNCRKKFPHLFILNWNNIR